MLSQEEQARVDRKYFNGTFFKLDYFFKPLRMTRDGVRVLDVGCGSGQHLRWFSPESVGITYTDDAVIEYVTAKYKLNIRKFNLDEEWPGDLGRFDIVFSADNIIHLASPFKLLLEMRYVLKDRGKLLIMIPQSSPLFRADKSVLHPYTFNRRTLLHMITRAGYQVESTSGFIRRLPYALNRLCESFTKRWGPNVWVVASKKEGFSISKGNIRPRWVPEKIWP